MYVCLHWPKSIQGFGFENKAFLMLLLRVIRGLCCASCVLKSTVVLHVLLWLCACSYCFLKYRKSGLHFLDLLLLSLSRCWGRIQVETCAHIHRLCVALALIRSLTHTLTHTRTHRGNLADSGLKASILLGNTLMVWSVSGVKMAGA